jgi:putative ABC transport system permease protein
MASWIVALRIARRQARRAKGRTALVVAMIGLPVLALVFATAVFDMQRLTPQEKLTRVMGSADGAVHYGSPVKAKGTGPDAGVVQEDVSRASTSYIIGSENGPHDAATILPYLPPGSSATGTWQAGVNMRTAHGVSDIEGHGIDAGSPITKGLTRLFRGRMPRSATEVALSSSALTRLGTRVGGTVATVDGTRFTVVGVAEVSGEIRDSMVFLPSAPIKDTDGYWLVKQQGAVTWAEIQGLNRHGFEAQSRAMMLHPPKDPAFSQERVAGLSPFGLGAVVVGLGLLEVVLLAGPAFAVGARRRQRQLALVAANGGTPAVLRRIVLGDGVVSGLLAAAIGTVVGLAGAYGLRGEMELRIFHQRFGGYRVDAWWIAAIVALAVVIGVLGALVPAFTAARQEVVLALSGRRGVHHSRLRWLLLGIGLIAAGALAAAGGAYRHQSAVTVAGLCVGEFGIVLCTPAIVGQIARLSRFLPLSPRIALRDVARRRSAAAPAISAVMAAVAGSIALTVYLGVSDQQREEFVPSAPIGAVVVTTAGWDSTGQNHPVDGAVPKISAALRDVFPGVTPVPVTTLVCGAQGMPICNAYAPVPMDQRCPYEPGGNLSAATIRKARADARCKEFVTVSNSIGGEVVTEDPAMVSAMTGLHGAALDAAVATLHGGGILVPDPSEVENGRALLSLGGLLTADDGTRPTGVSGQAPDTPPDELDISVPGYAVPAGATTPILSPAILTNPALKQAKLSSRIGQVVAMPASPVTQAKMDGLAAELVGVTNEMALEHLPVEHPSPVPLILAIAAGIVALGAAAIATGLAAADSRTDLTTLAAVGATPRVRRSLSLAQSGIIAGLGSVLGAIAGFGAAAAVLTGINQQYAATWPAPDPIPITVPWTNFVVSLVVVPVVAMLGAGLLTRSRLPSERRVA